MNQGNTTEEQSEFKTTLADTTKAKCGIGKHIGQKKKTALWNATVKVTAKEKKNRF